MGWLNEKYGNRIVSAILHVDEATPHIHALLVPLDDKGKLNLLNLLLQRQFPVAQKDEQPFRHGPHQAVL